MVYDFHALRSKILRQAQALVIEATGPGFMPIDQYCLLYRAALKGASALLPQLPMVSGSKKRKPMSVWKELAAHKINVEWTDYFLQHSAIVADLDCGIPHNLTDDMIREFYLAIQNFLHEVETSLGYDAGLKLAS